MCVFVGLYDYVGVKREGALWNEFSRGSEVEVTAKAEVGYARLLVLP